MKQYVCSICGYIYDEAAGGKWEDLPVDWKCPLCGADKSQFRDNTEQAKPADALDKPHVENELSAMEMSIICSNLARGCEKQYLSQQAEDFRKLAEFFRSKAEPVQEASTAKLLELIENDLSVGYPYGNAVSAEKPGSGCPAVSGLERKSHPDAPIPADTLQNRRGKDAGEYRRLGLHGLRLCLCGQRGSGSLSGMQGAQLEI